MLICDHSCVFEIKFWWNGFTSTAFPTLDRSLTFSYDCATFDHFQKLFLISFRSFFVGHFLFGVVVWKCQIVKIWSFFKEHGTVTIFCFFLMLFNQMINNFWQYHDLQHFNKYVPHFTEFVFNICKIEIIYSK